MNTKITFLNNEIEGPLLTYDQMSDNDLLSCTNSLVTIMVVINHRNIPWGPRCLQWCCMWCTITWQTSRLSFSLFSGFRFMYKGRNIRCSRPWFGGHEVIHIVITVNTTRCSRWCSMTWRTSGHLFLSRPSTITRRSSPPPSPSLRHKSTEDVCISDVYL